MSGFNLNTQHKSTGVIKKLFKVNSDDNSKLENGSITGFGTFPRNSSHCVIKSGIKIPSVPPKPVKSQKTFPAPLAPQSWLKMGRKYDSDHSINAIHTGKEKSSELESKSSHDRAASVSKYNLDGRVVDNDHEPIDNFLTNHHTSPTGGHDSLTLRTSSNNVGKNTSHPSKDDERTEVFSDEDDDPDAVYYSLQKFKNQSRVSWIEKVESMKLDDASKPTKKPIEKSLSYQWSGHDDDDDDEIRDYGLLESAKGMLDLRLAILKDVITDEKSYAGKLKKMSEQSRLVAMYVSNVQKDLEPAMEIIGNLLYLHKTFSNDIQKAAASDEQIIGDIIEKFVTEEFIQAKVYTAKYSSTVSTISKHQVLKSSSESYVSKKKDKVEHQGSIDLQSPEECKQELLQSFLASLSLPIWRFQNCIHNLERLIKFTPPSHLDYDHLQRALHMAKSFFSDFSASSAQDTGVRHLVKKGLVVEQVDEERKLRHLFLFNDVIVCAKHKINDKFSVQWFVPLCHLSTDDKHSALEDKHSANFYKEKTDSLKKNLIRYQAEYAREFKRMQYVEKNFLKNMRLEMCKKKLMELEAELFLNSPYLKMTLTSSELKKSFSVLLSSDYERAAWKNSINSFVSKVQPKSGLSKMTLSQAHNLIHDSKVSTSSPSCGVFQSSRIDGMLKLTIHKFLGLHSSSRVFCTVEVDSFGHFFLMAKTNTVLDVEPEWNEDFEIELEGSKTLRIMCYQIGQELDVQLGSTALELNEAWLKEKLCEGSVPISSNMFLKISVEYFSNEDLQALKSSVSSLTGGYFGIPIEEVTRTEETNIPLIITSCVEEIEKRGMKDLGLYRVSGLASEIKKLKTAFNKNSTGAINSLHRIDTNVLTGIVKLFLRELTDPLIPGSKYNNFMKCLLQTTSQDDDLAHQMASLPSPNFETILFLLQHLVRVSKEETTNKMTLGNLATIFGPSLMKNPTPSKDKSYEYLISNGTTDMTHQCKIALKLLTMVDDGYHFSRNLSN